MGSRWATLTARATAKVHFVRGLAQNLVLLKMNVQRRGKEQGHLRQRGVKRKTTEIRKMTKSMKGKEAKVAPDPGKESVNHHPSLVLDLNHVNVVDQDQEAFRQDREVEDDDFNFK